MIKKIASQTFTEGLVQDLNPLMASDKTLTNALNATIITMDGNENVLLNDMGNAKVEGARLPSGYIPVGTCELGGIIYIASYNPQTKKGLLGSIPSPELTSNRSGLSKNIDWSDLLKWKDSLYVNTDTSLIITKLDDEKYNPGDGFYIKGDKFPEYIKSTLYTKHNNREEIINNWDIFNEDISNIEELKNYDMFTSKYPGYLYLKLELFDAEPVLYIDRTILESKFVYEVHCSHDKLSTFKFYIDNTETPISELKDLGSGNYRITVEPTAIKPFSTINVRIVPVYKFNDVTIQRNDLAYLDTIDLSRIGSNIVSTIWRYSKDDSGMNLVFDILDYLSPDWSIDDVQLYYISHRNLNASERSLERNSENIRLAIQELEEIKQTTSLLDSDISLAPANSNIISLEKKSDKWILNYNSEQYVIANNDNKKFSYPISSDVEEVNIPEDFNFDKSSADYSFNEASEFPIVIITDGRYTVRFTWKVISISDNQGSVVENPKEYSEVLSYQEYNLLGRKYASGDWVIFEATTGTDYKEVSTIKYDWGKSQKIAGDSSKIYFELTGETWEFNSDGVTPSYITFSSGDKEIKWDLNSGANPSYPDDIIIPTDTPTTGGNIPVVNPPNPTTDMQEVYKSEWIEYPINSRRFADGIYKVTIPFNDYLVENSLYIVRIKINTINSKSETVSYYIERVLFTNGMYNDLFLKSTVDNKNFDEVAIKLVPTVDWNFKADYKLQTTKDNIQINNLDISDEDMSQIFSMVFSKELYENLTNQYGGSNITEEFEQVVTTNVSIKPYPIIENGFTFYNESVLFKNNSWNLPYSITGNSSIVVNENNQLEITDVFNTLFKLLFDYGKLSVNNYYRPILTSIKDEPKPFERQNLTYSDRIYSGTVNFNGRKHISRFAGLSIFGGGNDNTGGGSMYYAMGNFPIARVVPLSTLLFEKTTVKLGQTYIIQGVDNQSAALNMSSTSKYIENNKTLLSDAFGSNSETTATGCTPLIKQDEGKIKFPNDEFTSTLKSASKTKNNFPLFIPVLLVNGLAGTFKNLGDSFRVFSTYSERVYNNLLSSLDQFHTHIQPSNFRVLWLFGLTYIDGDYQYVPLNVFFLIYDGSTVLGKLETTNLGYRISSLDSTVGEMIYSYLTSIYYKSDDTNTYTPYIEYLSSFTANSAKELNISHSISTPKYKINGALLYDNTIQKNILEKLKTYFGFTKKCSNYTMKTDFDSDNITLEYTYQNPKFEIYNPITEKTLENFVYNPISNVYLSIQDTDSELWIKEGNSNTIIPINSKETYNLLKLKYSDSKLKANGYIRASIPNDLFVYQNNKLLINYDTYRSSGMFNLLFSWKCNTNSDTKSDDPSESSNKYSIKVSSLELFGKSFSLDSLPSLDVETFFGILIQSSEYIIPEEINNGD